MDLFEKIIFRNESLKNEKAPQSTRLPAPLQKARRMAPRRSAGDNRQIFLKQGKFLADYTDTYQYRGDPVRYYPTYQSLTDEELRGYFGWRTKARKGQYEETCLTFIFLYIYELLNNIGVKTPLAGYNRLLEIKKIYESDHPAITSYLEEWLADYVIYYDLDRSLLAESPNFVNNQCIGIIDNIENEPRDKVIDAIKQLCPKWLRRSKFYSEHFEDMDEVIFRVFKSMSRHYSKGYKKSFIEQFFGYQATEYVYLFSAAIFCNPLKRRNFEYHIDSQSFYKCENGIWSVNMRFPTTRGLRKMEGLLKSIDSLMREKLAYGKPVISENRVKWIDKLITGEIDAFLTEKAESQKKKLVIDFSVLDKIREDAGITQNRLVVEEEACEPAPSSREPVLAVAEAPRDMALAPQEERLVRCLLYGEDIDWVRAEGRILSVLVDSINDRLYEIFEDSVLDDSPEVLEDYVERLKELFPL